jgi:hypothetical protein
MTLAARQELAKRQTVSDAVQCYLTKEGFTEKEQNHIAQLVLIHEDKFGQPIYRSYLQKITLVNEVYSQAQPANGDQASHSRNKVADYQALVEQKSILYHSSLHVCARNISPSCQDRVERLYARVQEQIRSAAQANRTQDRGMDREL